MSARGSRPKIASGSVTEPAALPSMVVTLSSMSRALLHGGLGLAGLGLAGGFRRGVRQAELAGLGRLLGQRLLDRVAHCDPAALGAGHRAFHQDEATLDVGL